MIYFAEAVGVGNIKIGFTDDIPEQRVAQLQTGSPVPLRLLASIPGTLEDEKNLHRRFASDRVCGEWFKPSPELLALIPTSEPLVCGKVEVAERTVSIRVLTVGRKQFTKALLNQLPRKPVVNFSRMWIEFRKMALRGMEKDEIAASVDPSYMLYSEIWGRVNGDFDAGGRTYEVIHVQNGILCKQFDRDSIHWAPELEIDELGWVGASKPVDVFIATAAAVIVYQKFKRLPSWKDQLFIGV